MDVMMIRVKKSFAGPGVYGYDAERRCWMATLKCTSV